MNLLMRQDARVEHLAITVLYCFFGLSRYRRRAGVRLPVLMNRNFLQNNTRLSILSIGIITSISLLARSNSQWPYYTAGESPIVLLGPGGLIRSKSHNTKQQQSITKTISCKTPIPCNFAIAPMINGNVQPPALPNTHTNTTAATWRCFRRIFIGAIMASGNSRPRKKPRSMTAMAEVMKLSTV